MSQVSFLYHFKTSENIRKSIIYHDMFFNTLTHFNQIDLVGSLSKFQDAYPCTIFLLKIKCLVAKAATGSVLSKKMFLKISQNSQENTYVRVSFLTKSTLLKNILWQRCFPVNFGKFLKTPFLQNSSGLLLL